jgi:predicted nucleotidyltransferase
VDPVALARAAVERHPAVNSVELVGSRARGDPTELSDWDFLIQTDDLDLVAEALPELVRTVEPLAAQWDRLSEEASYFMLVLNDGTKVDFILHRPPDLQPPWVVTRETLAGVDAHFWDWIVWLGGKRLRGDDKLVGVMLSHVMYEHLLAPMGATAPPATIAEAVELFSALRDARERELGGSVDRGLAAAVRARLAQAGVL